MKISVWSLRFLSNCKLDKTTKKHDFLDTSDLQNATRKLIRIMQNSAFRTEIWCLKEKPSVPKNCKIISFNAFLDKDELFVCHESTRICGRSEFCNASNFQKYQNHNILLNYWLSITIKSFYIYEITILWLKLKFYCNDIISYFCFLYIFS